MPNRSHGGNRCCQRRKIRRLVVDFAPPEDECPPVNGGKMLKLIT